MKKIIAFAGSNSKQSINKQLAVYASTLVENVEVTILDLNDFKLPLFGVDLEAIIAHPANAHKFLEYLYSGKFQRTYCKELYKSGLNIDREI